VGSVEDVKRWKSATRSDDGRRDDRVEVVFGFARGESDQNNRNQVAKNPDHVDPKSTAECCVTH